MIQPAKVLLVDDEPAVLRAISRALRNENFEIMMASSGRLALELLALADIAVIISDHHMPGMNGAEFLEKAREMSPDGIRITLTGVPCFETATESINRGGVDHFLTKPWKDEQLRDLVRAGVRRFESIQQLNQLHKETTTECNELRDWGKKLQRALKNSTNQLLRTYDGTLSALIRTLDTREKSSAGHSRRVALYCLYFAMRAGLPFERLKDLYRGALLHDIGKIGVPDAILFKDGPLDANETQIVREHVSMGVEMLSEISYLRDAVTIPAYHHERFDGSGYPNQLAGDSIPIEARIFAIVDVYDALRSDRPYKTPMNHVAALKVIEENAGRHFDPSLVRVFNRVSVKIWESLTRHEQSSIDFKSAWETCNELLDSRVVATVS